MNMNEVIARINALAKKAKEGPLTEEEQAERDNLRRIYIDSVKANLVGQLENTYILQPDGTKKKVTKKYWIFVLKLNYSLRAANRSSGTRPRCFPGWIPHQTPLPGRIPSATFRPPPGSSARTGSRCF